MRRLIFVNIICAISLLPLLSLIYFFLLSFGFSAGSFSAFSVMLPLYRASWPLFALFALASVLISGPILLGAHYVVAKLIARDHVWVSELFTQARKRKGKGILLAFIALFSFYMLIWNLLIVSIGHTALSTLVSFVSITFFFFFSIVLCFVCQMLVRTELRFCIIVKNALILSRVYFWRNALALLVFCAYWMLLLPVFPLYSFVSYLFFDFALLLFLQIKACTAALERHVCD